MSLIRVIHVSLGLHLGGMEKLLVEFAKHADRNRFSLHFISLTTRGQVAEEIERAGWSVTTMGESQGVRMTLPLRLRGLFRDLDGDVVHTHNTRPLLYSAPAARLAGVGAVVHTRHGQRLGASRRQTALFNLACRWVDRVVSVSSDSTELARAQGIAPRRLLTVPNGIDLASLPFREHRANGPVVFVGRLSPEKNVDILLHAIALLRERGSNPSVILAGDGPERARLESLRATLRLTDNVHFIGAISDVPALLNSAGILVLPSRSEGISLALLEAMACGVPVLATRVGGSVEVIEDGVSGSLVASDDPEALADAVDRLLSDPAHARALAAAGRDRVERHFNVRDMVRRYESLYVSILEGRRLQGAA